jgi:hypothetical protein
MMHSTVHTGVKKEKNWLEVKKAGWAVFATFSALFSNRFCRNKNKINE